MKLELAKAILAAMKIREESYDHAAANAQQLLNDAEREAPGAGPYAGMGTDWGKFYVKSLEEACREASPEFAELLHPMLYSMWNEAAEWASGVIKLQENANSA